MNDYTPGPWEARAWEGEGSRKGLLHRIARPDGLTIARVTPTGTDADARLIAAAPEMAELLETIAEAHDDGGQACSCCGAAAELLSRIRGEAEVPA